MGCAVRQSTLVALMSFYLFSKIIKIIFVASVDWFWPSRNGKAVEREDEEILEFLNFLSEKTEKSTHAML